MSDWNKQLCEVYRNDRILQSMVYSLVWKRITTQKSYRIWKTITVELNKQEIVRRMYHHNMRSVSEISNKVSLSSGYVRKILRGEFCKSVGYDAPAMRLDTYSNFIKGLFCQTMIELGYTIEGVASFFKVSERSIFFWLKLLQIVNTMPEQSVSFICVILTDYKCQDAYGGNIPAGEYRATREIGSEDLELRRNGTDYLVPIRNLKGKVKVIQK